jgi:hypothetical protein
MNVVKSFYICIVIHVNLQLQASNGLTNENFKFNVEVRKQ